MAPSSAEEAGGALAALLTELETLQRAWDADEDEDGARVSATLARARALGPALDPERAAALQAGVAAAIRSADSRHRRLDEKLKGLSGGRRAIRGYGSLKSYRDGQKIQVKA